MFDDAWWDQETRGDDDQAEDDRTHGSNAHTAEWWRSGATDNRTTSCNTFAAKPAEVS